MIDIITAYISASLSTAILSYFKLFSESKCRLIDKNYIEHVFVTNSIISGITWFILSLITAPLLLPIIIFDNLKENFIEKVVQ